jgi:GNAT superfamily N-acetyltransferase
MNPSRAEPPANPEIRELSDVPQADWTSLFAGETDPFEIEPLALAWRAKDTHFVLYAEGRAASHVSILLRHVVRVSRESVPVTGVAGVLTRPDLRGRGLARRVLAHALRETRSRAATSFALLFCLPKLVSLYRELGWQEVAPPVLIEQPSGAAPAPLPAMVLALGERPWPAGPVDLDSRPW